MALYLLFFVTVAGVVLIAVDPGDPEAMHRPPRDPDGPDDQPVDVLLDCGFFRPLYGVITCWQS